MSLQYDNYIKEHKKNVLKGLEFFQKKIPELVHPLADNILYHVDLGKQFWKHDQSKYSVEEYDAYDAYFYGGNRSHKVVSEFNKAWLHHIHNNPHHWQYYILVQDDEETLYLDIPYNYIIEMICDWWAFSWAKGDLFEIFKWYDDHKNKMKLSDKTRKTVENILDKLEEVLNNEQ